MNSCKTCDHWKLDKSSQHGSLGIGECINAIEFWDCYGWSDGGEIKLVGDGLTKKAFTQDGSDYISSFLTKSDFFCSEFVQLSK